MQEESDRVIESGFAQHATERHQLIVMYPDEVVFTDNLAQSLGIETIDREISVVFRSVVAKRAREVVMDRPERAVAKAVVVRFETIRGQVDRSELNAAVFLNRRCRRRIFACFATPTEPHAAARTLERGEHSDRKTSCGRTLIREGYPIRHGDETGHQCFLMWIA